MGTIQRVAGTLPIALDSHHSPARGVLGPRWVTFGRSRVRESRTLGSVGAKAEWLSYPTNPSHGTWRWTPRPRAPHGRRRGLPAGSGQIICSRERTDHVLPTLMLDFTLTRGD